jgi:protein-tyrosine phosphatase
MSPKPASLAALMLVAFVAAPAARALENPTLERTAPDAVSLHWKSAGPVDIYVAAAPDADFAHARLLAKADGAGAYTAANLDPARPYFILEDETDGSVARVADRLLPLQMGSNFRDLGGYPAAGGKHVRWGVIYRTAAEPMLSEADYAYLRGLGLKATIDLRSLDERRAVPDTFPEHLGVRYYATDYSGQEIFGRLLAPPTTAPATPVVSAYRSWLVSLAPQYREIFHQLLEDQGAVSYHCSAGQDRTGVATALILTALGVPREVILQDYHLSTADRRPEYEMPKLDPAKYPGNSYVAFVARMQAAGAMPKPRPLLDEHGAALLQQTFDEIDAHWGGVEAYLDKELGVGPKDIARLRAIYLE